MNRPEPSESEAAVHWAGWIRDSALEEAFQAARFDDVFSRARFGVGMVAILTLLTVIVDVFTAPAQFLPLLPNRLAVMFGGVLFVGRLAPKNLTELGVRATLLYTVYATGLAHQHLYRNDPPGMVLVWLTILLFGTSVWRLVPARWLAGTHAYCITVMATAGLLLDQRDAVVEFTLFSTVGIGIAFIWFGMQQDRFERSQQIETWRATKLAESREAVLAAIAHELRTPLAVARMAVAVAQKVPERSLPLLEQIDRRLVGLSELVDTVLRLGSLDVVRTVEPVNLNVLLQEILDDQQPLHPDLQLEVHGEMTVPGDAALWHTALMNLVQNGVRFAKGRVRCGVDERFVTIEDDGTGVPREDRERIFDPMVRLTADRGDHPGFGMGLALSRRILAAHGATIEVDDSPLGGARFKIGLHE